MTSERWRNAWWSVPKINRARLALVLVVSAGAMLRFRIAAQDPVFLLGKILPDDAYYYFSLARSLATGEGPVADGLNPTNGFHPLWLLIITPLFRFAGTTDIVTPIRLTLGLCALRPCWTWAPGCCLALASGEQVAGNGPGSWRADCTC